MFPFFVIFICPDLLVLLLTVTSIASRTSIADLVVEENTGITDQKGKGTEVVCRKDA
jgi:hypothetical protein